MTVKELKEILSHYPDHMKIITTIFSDYSDLPTPEVYEVLYDPSVYIYKRYWPNQFPERPVNVEAVLHLGN